MLKIGYKINEELVFKLKDIHKNFKLCSTYEKTKKNGKIGYEVSLWLFDSSSYYKKYMCGDFFENNRKEIKHAIKIAVNKMIENNVFDSYIKIFDEEIDCIGKMYLK